jgi:hypothetical protein
MSEFPNDISIYKPIPGKAGFKNCMGRKDANYKGNCCYRNKSADKCIENIGKERNFIINYFKLPVETCSQKFNDKEDG